MTDPVSDIYRQLVNLFRNDPDWMIADQNFIHYADIKGLQEPENPVVADGDFPRALLEGPVSGNSAMATDNAVFATHADVDDPQNPANWGVPGLANKNTVNYTERATYDFRLTMWSLSERLDEYGPLLVRAVRVVRRAGARLGLRWVTGVTFRFTCQLTEEPESQIRRWQIALLLSVQTEIEEAVLDARQ